MSPTRELARQIYQVAEPFLETIPWLKALLLVGGTCAPPPLNSCSLRLGMDSHTEGALHCLLQGQQPGGTSSRLPRAGTPWQTWPRLTRRAAT